MVNTWLMPFNHSKCWVLHLGSANQGSIYTMDNALPDSTPLENYLGVKVEFDTELKFREQASAAVNKATQVPAVIQRSFAHLDDVTLPLLFKTLV